MSQTHTDNPAVQTLWQRLGSGLFLFSLVLSGVLTVSWSYALPRITSVKLQGRTVDLSVIIPYEQQLRAQILDAEGKRNKVVLPVQDARFEALKRLAVCYPSLQDMNGEIVKTAAALGENAVTFTGMKLDAGELTLIGDVRNVGPRSMTVLAELVEDLKELSFVASSTAPAFVREKDASGFYSPFSFTLTLKAADSCPLAA